MAAVTTHSCSESPFSATLSASFCQRPPAKPEVSQNDYEDDHVLLFMERGTGPESIPGRVAGFGTAAPGIGAVRSAPAVPPWARRGSPAEAVPIPRPFCPRTWPKLRGILPCEK